MKIFLTIETAMVCSSNADALLDVRDSFYMHRELDKLAYFSIIIFSCISVIRTYRNSSWLFNLFTDCPYGL